MFEIVENNLKVIGFVIKEIAFEFTPPPPLSRSTPEDTIA
jgi:hypothetical protein